MEVLGQALEERVLSGFCDLAWGRGMNSSFCGWPWEGIRHREKDGTSERNLGTLFSELQHMQRLMQTKDFYSLTKVFGVLLFVCFLRTSRIRLCVPWWYTGF